MCSKEILFYIYNIYRSQAKSKSMAFAAAIIDDSKRRLRLITYYTAMSLSKTKIMRPWKKAASLG